MKNIIALLVSFSFVNAFGATDSFITDMKVNPDLRFEDAHGLYITYHYDFNAFVKDNNGDTSLLRGDFKILTRLYVNGKVVKPALGYSNFTGASSELLFLEKLHYTDIQLNEKGYTNHVFIPYAALSLPEGQHTLTVEGIITGKDAKGNSHTHRLRKNDISITKPATRLVTMNIDYIEVTKQNANGNAWDVIGFHTDAPDVRVSLKVGSATVWKNNVNDNCVFAVGPYSKNIQYTISAGDRLIVRIDDMDMVFNDFIAEWNFETTDKAPGKKYFYNKGDGVIKSVSLDFQID